MGRQIALFEAPLTTRGVAEIVKAHGGSTVAEESPDGWCRFSVRLPLEGVSG